MDTGKLVLLILGLRNINIVIRQKELNKEQSQQSFCKKDYIVDSAFLYKI